MNNFPMMLKIKTSDSWDRNNRWTSRYVTSYCLYVTSCHCKLDVPYVTCIIAMLEKVCYLVCMSLTTLDYYIITMISASMACACSLYWRWVNDFDHCLCFLFLFHNFVVFVHGDNPACSGNDVEVSGQQHRQRAGRRYSHQLPLCMVW